MNNKKLRIAHICQASSYTEGMLYQDNVLPDVNRADGHEVLIVADCTCYVDGKIREIPEEDKKLENGIRLVRLGFSLGFLSKIIRDKVRYAPKLKPLLEEFRPDVILYHSLVGVGLLTVGDYKRKKPRTRLYVDSHADFNNSGRSFVSRWLQYKIFNRFLWSRISQSVEKVLYISSECKEFLREMYKIEDSIMEFFPLGGFIQDEKNKKIIRNRVRDENFLSEDDIVFIHTGKMNESKCTLNVISSFAGLPHENFRLLLVGVLESEIASEAKAIIDQDNRIAYLGWKSGDELFNLLTASDCYVQPGSQSATLQAAICCGLPVILYPHPSHAPYLKSNGVYVRSSAELKKAFNLFAAKAEMQAMSLASVHIAEQLLDYNKIAKRIYK